MADRTNDRYQKWGVSRLLSGIITILEDWYDRIVAGTPITVTFDGVDTPTVYNLTLAVADTEYSQLLTANTKEFRFRCRTLFDVRYAFVTGNVAVPTAPWLTLPAGSDYWSDGDDLPATTLYFATDEAGVILEIEEWL